MIVGSTATSSNHQTIKTINNNRMLGINQNNGISSNSTVAITTYSVSTASTSIGSVTSTTVLPKNPSHLTQEVLGGGDCNNVSGKEETFSSSSKSLVVTPTATPTTTSIQYVSTSKGSNGILVSQQSSLGSTIVTTVVPNNTGCQKTQSFSTTSLPNSSTYGSGCTNTSVIISSPGSGTKSQFAGGQLTQSTIPATLSTTETQWLYICDWRNCPRYKFKSISDLQHHVCTAHVPEHLDAAAEIFCQWGTGPGLCDGIPRKRFALMTHLIERHLTTDSLRNAVQRRISTGVFNIMPSKPPVTIVRNLEPSLKTGTVGASVVGSGGGGVVSNNSSINGGGNNCSLVSICKSNIGSNSSHHSFTAISANIQPQGSPQVTTLPSPILGPSALQAIKRHTADFMTADEMLDEKEGPVTKSIRLTAALILRNLVTYTATAKRNLRRYESHLANIALSNMEASGIVSNILFELSN